MTPKLDATHRFRGYLWEKSLRWSAVVRLSSPLAQPFCEGWGDYKHFTERSLCESYSKIRLANYLESLNYKSTSHRSIKRKKQPKPPFCMRTVLGNTKIYFKCQKGLRQALPMGRFDGKENCKLCFASGDIGHWEESQTDTNYSHVALEIYKWFLYSNAHHYIVSVFQIRKSVWLVNDPF